MLPDPKFRTVLSCMQVQLHGRNCRSRPLPRATSDLKPCGCFAVLSCALRALERLSVFFSLNNNIIFLVSFDPSRCHTPLPKRLTETVT